jgi:hypothetical protein
MSISGAGGNRSRFLIAWFGPWSAIGDDFGPYNGQLGYTKFRFETTGNSSGYEITIYDGSDPAIDDFIFGKFNKSLGIRLSPNPPPVQPVASYGAASFAAPYNLTENNWSPTVGPSAQGAPGGAESNPIVTNGTQGQKLFSGYPIYYVRAKITNITAATGSGGIWAVAVP